MDSRCKVGSIWSSPMARLRKWNRRMPSCRVPQWEPCTSTLAQASRGHSKGRKGSTSDGGGWGVSGPAMHWGLVSSTEHHQLSHRSPGASVTYNEESELKAALCAVFSSH